MGPVSAMTNRKGLESKLFQSPSFFPEVLKGIFLIDSVPLQEAIQRNTAQAEHLAQVKFADASGPEFFEDERFQGADLQLVMNGFAAPGEPPVRRKCERSGPRFPA